MHAATSVGALNAKSPAVAPLGPEIPLTAKVGCVIVTCPMFVTCTVYALLEFPTTTVPRFTAAGEIPRVGGSNPVPVSVTFAAATPWLVVPTVRVAVVAPAATGENIKATVHEPFAATLAPQVVVPTTKLREPDPAIEKLGCPSGDPPLLVIVTVLATLGTFICSLPKATVVADKLISGGFSPVPASFTDCARMASEISSVPVSDPATLGENVTVTAHDEPAANWPPQLLTALKSVLPAELETDVPMLVSGSPPLLVIVTVNAGEVCPSTVDAKLKLVVESVSVGPSTPVPVSAALSVPTLEFTLRLPVAGPAAVGA
jgi:hypothetical protein